MDKEAMQQYMFKSPKGTGYLFRRGVPADVREAIGKREFKHTLGGDYRSACLRCRELAVETDQLIQSARASETPAPVPPASAPSAAQPQEVPLNAIHEVTPSFIAQLRASIIDQVLLADQRQRYRSMSAVNVQDKLSQFERVRNLARLAQLGDYTAALGWRDMLTGTLTRNGYCLASGLQGSEGERILLVEYASAYGEALDILEAQYTGKHLARSHSASLPLSSPPSARDVGTKLLSEAIKEFLAHLPAGKRAMNEKHGFILPAFLELVGDMPIGDLKQSHMKDFLLTVQKLPPRWSSLRRKRSLTIRELAAQDWDETISLKTYEAAYRVSLRSFIDQAVIDWQDVGFPTTLTASVPYAGLRTKAERKQRALQVDEIQLIFFNESMERIVSSPRDVHKFWLLAIELFTGARVREICQLNPQHDFGQSDGIWWLRLTADAGNAPDPEVTKSVKTNRPRTIPLHPELVRLGLPAHLELLKQHGARRLFPRWPVAAGDAGSAAGKWVANYMRKIGLHGVQNENGNAVRGSHTFRHTLLTHGKKAGVNLRCISGHKESSDNEVADGYEDETILVNLAEKNARLARLDYGVTLPVPVVALAPAVRSA